MLSKFCCMRLTTGGYVVGFLGIFGSILFTILFVIALANIEAVASIIEKSIKENVNPEDLAYELKISLVGFAVNLLISTLLVMGIRKKRPALLIPWLAISGFAVVCNFCYCLVVILSIIVDGGRMLPIPATLPYLSLHIYIYYGIYSLYSQLCIGDVHPCPPARTGSKDCTAAHPV